MPDDTFDIGQLFDSLYYLYDFYIYLNTLVISSSDYLQFFKI
jgi:hypothetical protein